MNRLVIAAPYSGSGKTTFCIALIGALRKRGYTVAPYKVGPDYIDTAYHARAAGRSATNLDAFLLGEMALLSSFAANSSGADISIIEGVMGLFDGIGPTSEASTAQVAKALDAPVLLVVDGGGMAASASALVSGFAKLDPEVRIEAVVFNGVGKKHYELLKEAVERDTGIKCAGYLPRDERAKIPSRHLGILPETELAGVDELLGLLAELALKSVDVGALAEIAASAPKLPAAEAAAYEKIPCTLAVAKDAAFNFYYSDSLKTLEAMGARLVYFSPLSDSMLPECGGVYIGGGFPEVFAERLAQNITMRESIRAASLAGMPVYAECGGYIYLGRSLDAGGVSFPMCSALDVSAAMGKGLSGQFGYVNVSLGVDTPLGGRGISYRAHEFHHSVMTGEGGSYTVRKPDGREWRGGTARLGTFGAFAHVHFGGEPGLAKSFLSAAKAFGERR